MKTTVILISLLILIASCEDVIELELDGIEPILVIEGTINDQDGQCTVKLSMTGDYFDPGIYQTVSDAVITITDDKGITINFTETEPGRYLSENFQGTELTGYTLDVLSEGENYTANVTMPQKVVIDSLSYEIPSSIMGFDEGYVVNCHFRDPLEFTNYYRLIAYSISDNTEGISTQYVFNDSYVNGNNLYMQWESDPFLANDTVVVELQTLDKSTYEYYYTLFPITGGGLFVSNPANPKTNLSNDALGYFGTFTISRDTIIISPI